MIQRTASIIILLLIVVSAFGQRKEFEKGKKTNRVEQEQIRDLQDLLFQNKRDHSHTSMLKNVQDQSSLDAQEIRVWNESTSQWISYILHEYSYDSNGNIVLYIYSEMNATSNQVAPAWRVEYTFDANNNLTEYIENYMDETSGEWTKNWKEENTYDSNGNLLSTIGSGWNGQWISISKNDYTYDVNDQMTLNNAYIWEGAWSDTTKVEVSYNGNGNISEVASYAWSSSIADWVGTTQNRYTYNESQQKTHLITADWVEADTWADIYQSVYTYDASGNTVQEIESEWSNLTNGWEEDWKGEYTYDASNNPASEHYFEIDASSGFWVENTKYDYTYDLSLVYADLLAPPTNWLIPDYRNQIVSKPLECLNQDLVDGSWINYAKWVYAYDVPGANSVQELEAGKLSIVYPNPATDFLSFTFSDKQDQLTFELFEMTGRRVMNKLVSNNERIGLEEMNNGIYLYRLSSNDKRQSGKLIIKR